MTATQLNLLECGHFGQFGTLPIDCEQCMDDLVKTSVDGSKTARNYQVEGINFIINSGFNCIIGDQMRLGKTPQALLALRNKYEERTPCLIIVRSANLWQWLREYKVWTDSTPTGIFIIEGSKNWIPPGFKSYIISMDTLARGKRVEELKAFGFKLVIADEAHSFKNTESKRSQAFIKFLKEMNHADITQIVPFTCHICKHQWEETITISNDTTRLRFSKYSKCPAPDCRASVYTSTEKIKTKVDRKCGALMLTGTPIKNNAAEYYVPLHIVGAVQESKEQFERTWLDWDRKRIPNYKLDSFKTMIKPFVLRREKEDVFTDLPKINRMFTVIEIGDERIKAAYNAILDKMNKEMNERSSYNFFDSLGDLMILRQLCGIAKVDWTVDYLETSLMEGNEKYAIGLHHHLVRDALRHKIGVENTLSLSGEDSAAAKDSIMTRFEYSKEQVLLINMLAGGVGMDFHYCHNILILERQWSSADEEQFEFRFYNPDKSIMGNHTTQVEYIIAKGTIDEFFYDLVEEKRRIFGETIGTNWDLSTDKESFKKLIEKTIVSRL